MSVPAAAEDMQERARSAAEWVAARLPGVGVAGGGGAGSSSLRVVSAAAVGAAALVALGARVLGRRSVAGRLEDRATLGLLAGEAVPAVPEGLRALVGAFMAVAGPADDEGRCVEEMRALVVAGHLRYATLVDAPELVLEMGSHIPESDRTALGTRFTVQYNLYAGSVVALGSDAQRAALFAMQPTGELGCFAFTERGGGVLTGVACDTTATFDRERQSSLCRNAFTCGSLFSRQPAQLSISHRTTAPPSTDSAVAHSASAASSASSTSPWSPIFFFSVGFFFLFFFFLVAIFFIETASGHQTGRHTRQASTQDRPPLEK
jgi:hypothetical protein